MLTDMHITATTMINLLRQTEKAAKVAVRNRFLIETYFSAMEARAGKTSRHSSAKDLFRKLEV